MRFDGLAQIVPPVVRPVTVADVKAWLRLDGDDEDALLEALIDAATDWAEAFTGRQLVRATWQGTIDEGFPDAIDLPHPPLVSVMAVAYVDADGAAQTVAAADYTVLADRIVGRIVPAYGACWPSTRAVPQAVTVTWVAGFAPPAWAVSTAYGIGSVILDGDDDTVWLCKVAHASGTGLFSADRTTHAAWWEQATDADAVPKAVRTAVRMIVGHLYEHREMTAETALAAVPYGVRSLLYPHRIW